MYLLYKLKAQINKCATTREKSTQEETKFMTNGALLRPLNDKIIMLVLAKNKNFYIR